MSLVEMSFVVLCALAAVAAGLIFVARGRPVRVALPDTDTLSMHFLFRDLDLEHASNGAEPFVKNDETSTDWGALRRNLGTRFPGLPDEAQLRGVNRLTLNAVGQGDQAVIHLDREDDITRLTIEDAAAKDLRSTHTVKSMEAELGTLRLAAVGAPYPIWLMDDDGAVIWRNTAYDALQANTASHESHPAKSLFGSEAAQIQPGHTVRVSIPNQTDDTLEWFSVTATDAPDSTIFHAVNINAVIHAEVAQRNFVQTLAKTFAQLSIGLAIFDRNGQLALFNPALVDLTSLPAEFLSARPDLLSFFDRLRDNRVMPEPKNYVSWRQEISNVIAAASNGSYQETWSLDTGHTFRVIGRPHPDGAVAFLIEDITAEVSLTRNFRAELELGQSLMDTFEDALVVFSSAGVLTFCNAAYTEMWKLDPDNSFADVTIVDSIKDWQAQCRPDPAWGDMRDYVMKLGDRAPWDARVHHLAKGEFVAQVSPIVSGATVIRFTEVVEAPMPAKVT
ncbi:PAS-domain containing protein [uncultured Tateyamaria sp.]|uniref:PAS-domain containing protein n=1 Tax=uncultured Tateyamaria sp. TaxID=455651 RepID=UPI00260C69F5|nr:PAS-domain containing protein [uncultured Tateyamaria sp.]